ncbi:MAG TPA: feruloyl-CoA synthase [Bryobacteraceae bacterium]|nr:feruloyl-CoA synthase [Bryobacteraceae bacterium]
MRGEFTVACMQSVPVPFRPLNVASWSATVEKAADGNWYVRPNMKLGSYARTLTERLDYWAGHAPDVTFLAERSSHGGWRRATYAGFRSQARSVAQWLLDRKLPAGRPIAILSGNDIEHAILAFAAMYCGITYAPVSPAYSLISQDLKRLTHIFELLSPGLVFAADGVAFDRAIRAVVPRDTVLVVCNNPPSWRPAELFQALLATPATSAVDDAQAATGPDNTVKILFTSGSTSVPKGVITTQRMLCSNQEMIRTVFRFFTDEPPVICDWTPWHHTFGGSHNIGLVLYNGGTMYIDRGKPLPGAFDESLRNLRQIAQTVFFNVPKGFEMLVASLAADDRFREHFFSRLRMAFFAAAGLPQHIWNEFDRLAIQAIGARIPILTGLGSTETAPFALCAADPTQTRSGVVGLPAPGVELKLAPVNGKLEACVRGPNVTPGFWAEPGRTRAAFDEEGYYRMGDALSFIDAEDPAKGFLFDGRITEDFKLSTGTWVSVGPLRARFILHAAPWVRDLVIAGRDRDEVTALIFPDADHYARLDENGTARAVFENLLRGFARQSTGSSNRIVRAIVLSDGPRMEAGEVTDKGSINQAAVLKHRAGLVEQLYMDPAPQAVIMAQ